jgi:hypothetical protein
MVNQRIQKLGESLSVEKYPLSIEKIRLVTQTFRQTEGEPQILRRAKALANVLDNITIFIEDGELIVGNTASKPMALEVDYDYGTWSQEEIDGLKEEGYVISQKDEAELRALDEYWDGKTLVGRSGEILADERLWPFLQSGVVLPPWKSKREGSGGGYAQGGMGLGPGFYLWGFDFAKVINGGLNKILEDLQAPIRSKRRFFSSR